jgi:hypothetical protein
MSNSGASIACPSCGVRSSGKYCAECGSALLGATCASCGALMTPGARFCHQCGAAAGTRGVAAAAVPTPDAVAVPTLPVAQRSVLPWVVGVAALLALVIAVAVQNSSTAPLGATSGAPLAGGDAPAPFAAGGATRAPDISSLSPRERADRLYDRVMRQSAEGKADSAAFFASMAMQAYELLGPLDNDLRYDYGRMAEVAGNLSLAQSQVDTILASSADHLLGLILGARLAQRRNDAAARSQYNTRLLAAQATELKKPLEEYTRHRDDIDAAIAEARTGK